MNTQASFLCRTNTFNNPCGLKRFLGCVKSFAAMRMINTYHSDYKGGDEHFKDTAIMPQDFVFYHFVVLTFLKQYLIKLVSILLNTLT